MMFHSLSLTTIASLCFIPLLVHAALKPNARFGQAPSYQQSIFPPNGPRPDPNAVRFDDVFEFKTDDVAKGGCTSDEKTSLEKAVVEVVTMAAEAYDFLNEELGGTTRTKAQGQMLNNIFGLQPSYALQAAGKNPLTDRGEDIKQLEYMRGLMIYIGRHASGDLKWIDPDFPQVPKTRLYCNAGWLEDNGQGDWRDIVTGSLESMSDEVPPDKVLGACGPTIQGGPESEAFTNVQLNAITICPLAWKQWGALPVIDQSAQKPDGSVRISQLQAISTKFFHEYTHLVGTAAIGIDVQPKDETQSGSDDGIYYSSEDEDEKVNGGVTDQELPKGIPHEGEEAYGFALCTLLVSTEKTTHWRSVTNADSYMLLATACFLKDYDWSDGFCKPLESA